jgi:phosphoglycolate phosphatase
MHLIFDLDGTLVDSRPGLKSSFEGAVRQVQPDIDAGLLNFQIGPAFRTIMQQALGKVSGQDLDKLEAAFRAIYDNEGWKESQLYPNVIKTLQELHHRGNLLYIVTNKPQLPTDRILKRLAINHYFVEVISPDSRLPKFMNKNESLIYLLDRYFLPIHQTIYIGDTEEDFSISQACRLRFIGLEYGYGIFSDSVRPDCLISSFPDLLGLI